MIKWKTDCQLKGEELESRGRLLGPSDSFSMAEVKLCIKQIQVTKAKTCLIEHWGLYLSH